MARYSIIWCIQLFCISTGFSQCDSTQQNSILTIFDAIIGNFGVCDSIPFKDGMTYFYCDSNEQVQARAESRRIEGKEMRRRIAFYCAACQNNSEYLVIIFSESGCIDGIHLRHPDINFQVMFSFNELGLLELLHYGADSNRGLISVPSRYWQFHKNEEIQVKYELDSTDYLLKSFYDDGSLKSVGTISQGLQYRGQYVEYYQNGIIRRIGQYKNHYNPSEMSSIPMGIWIDYTENGEVLNIVDYNKND